jgi:pyrroline-5-carboxylate reductase
MANVQSPIAILGCGTMGEAIVAGLLASKARPAQALLVTSRRQARRDALEAQYGVRVFEDNHAAIEGADIVLLCLKPQGAVNLLSDPSIVASLEGKVIVSIAAGVPLARLLERCPNSACIRAMPNTPCTAGKGMTVLARAPGVLDAHLESVRDIFCAVGRCIELDDAQMDAVTALNGSGPAFVYVMIEALTDGGVMMGLPRDRAVEIAASVFEGAASMVLTSGAHPAALKDDVTTPAGCTIAGLLTMEDGRIRSVLARTIQEAASVASKLGGEPPFTPVDKSP